MLTPKLRSVGGLFGKPVFPGWRCGVLLCDAMHWRAGLAVVLMLAGAVLPGRAAQYYVATNGSDGAAGTSWGAAWLTISNAVFQATNGDTITVSNGAYRLSAYIYMNKSLVVSSFLGRASTLLDGTGGVRCVYLDHSNAVLDGFTLTNGYVAGGGGGGAYINHGWVRNCTIRNCTATNSGGGGIIMYNTDARITDSDIFYNFGNQYGGGAIVMSGVLGTNCLLYGNTAADTSSDNGGGGAYLSGAGSRIDGCVVSNNYQTTGSRPGGGLYLTAGAVATNCTITTNYAAYGGGIYARDTTGGVYNCVISNNLSSSGGGGGAYFANGSALIADCVFYGNTCQLYGGGFFGYGVVSNCLFTRNRVVLGLATYGGGGARLEGGSSRMERCVVSNNFATANEASGGGIYLGGAGLVTNCVIVTNSADQGGGIAIFAAANVYNCIISNNTAYDWSGGGMWCTVSTAMVVNCVFDGNTAAAFAGGLGSYGTLRNCLFIRNRANSVTYGGGALFPQSDQIVENCTIVSNYAVQNGGGINNFGGAGTGIKGINNIVYGNTAGNSGSNFYIATGTLTLSNSLTAPLTGLTGSNNISTDPAFVNAGALNYRLRNVSPCINAGINAAWMSTTGDLDGRRRIINNIVDMGAYEFLPPGAFFSVR